MNAILTRINSQFAPEKHLPTGRGLRIVEEGFVTFVDATVEGRPVKWSFGTDMGRNVRGGITVSKGTDADVDAAHAAFVSLRGEWRSTGGEDMDEWCWDNRPEIDVFLAA